MTKTIVFDTLAYAEIIELFRNFLFLERRSRAV